MSKDSNKKDIHGDAHDTLVKSLESIKDLLLQSETKISAARESIAKAGMSGKPGENDAIPTDAESTQSTKDEQAPLFDLASTKTPEQESDKPSASMELPLLDDIVAPGESEVDEATEIEKEEMKTDTSVNLDLQALDEFQAIMEDKIHKTVVQAIIKIEARLKSQLEKQIAILRRNLKDRD